MNIKDALKAENAERLRLSSELSIAHATIRNLRAEVDSRNDAIRKDHEEISQLYRELSANHEIIANARALSKAIVALETPHGAFSLGHAADSAAFEVERAIESERKARCVAR